MDTDSRQAGIEITDEMIEAGFAKFWEYDVEEVGSRVVVEAVIRAGLSVWNQSKSETIESARSANL